MVCILQLHVAMLTASPQECEGAYRQLEVATASLRIELEGTGAAIRQRDVLIEWLQVVMMGAASCGLEMDSAAAGAAAMSAVAPAAAVAASVAAVSAAVQDSAPGPASLTL